MDESQERGKYRHPEEWGQPESKGVDYERTQKLREQPTVPRAEMRNL